MRVETGGVKALKKLMISGREVLPLVEGGKGIAVSSGLSAGAWAAAGAVGTFSGVNADFYDETGRMVEVTYKGKTRGERHLELIDYAIKGGTAQARIAHEVSGGEGRIHMNVLWEMGGCERILEGILTQAKGLIHGVTCGAGMPYRLAEIAARYGVYYYPIVSSARAFRALWKRAYHKSKEWLGGVVYEDPWLAGGHNGLSNSENPRHPEPPYPRVAELRREMNALGLSETPVVMAGGVWSLSDWEDWIDNPEIGPLAFQFGTRPLLTRESPIPEAWKKRLLTLDPGDVLLHRFSPTGFYSSAVKNAFVDDLVGRSERQVPFAAEADGELSAEIAFGRRGRAVFVKPEDKPKVEAWLAAGFTEALKTPDETLVFVTPESARRILKDQSECMGCLSACHFSNWSQNEEGTTGRRPDPRSFCIQKTLQAIAHAGDVEHELMFSGHNAHRFKTDPFYKNGFVPTVKELIDHLLKGG
jgi:NAD(P)H-dependent flavin oxidoreductase YrpB (nitropropane dioxygenase family)